MTTLSVFFLLIRVSVVKMQSYLPVRRISPLHLLQRHGNDDAVDIREPLAALSGISRAICLSFVLIQRFLPYFLPVISADIFA